MRRVGVVEWFWAAGVVLVGDSVGVLAGVLFGDVYSVLCVVMVGVSIVASAPKKLARTCLLSCLLVIHIASCDFRSAILQENISWHMFWKYGFQQLARNKHLFAGSISLWQLLCFCSFMIDRLPMLMLPEACPQPRRADYKDELFSAFECTSCVGIGYAFSDSGTGFSRAAQASVVVDISKGFARLYARSNFKTCFVNLRAHGNRSFPIIQFNFVVAL